MSKRPLSSCCGASIRREECTGCHKQLSKAARLAGPFAMAAASNRPSGPFAMMSASKIVRPLQSARNNSAPNAWSAADDKWLWEHKGAPVSELSLKLKRGEGAIDARLKHLHDPSHAAFQRMHQTNGTAASSSGSQ